MVLPPDWVNASQKKSLASTMLLNGCMIEEYQIRDLKVNRCINVSENIFAS